MMLLPFPASVWLPDLSFMVFSVSARGGLMSIFIAFLGSHLKKKILADFGLSPFFFEVIDQFLTRSAPLDTVAALD